MRTARIQNNYASTYLYQDIQCSYIYQKYAAMFLVFKRHGSWPDCANPLANIFFSLFLPYLSIRTPLPRTTPVLKFKRSDLVLQHLPRHVCSNTCKCIIPKKIWVTLSKGTEKFETNERNVIKCRASKQNKTTFFKILKICRKFINKA